MRGKAERDGLAQPREKKAQGRPDHQGRRWRRPSAGNKVAQHGLVEFVQCNILSVWQNLKTPLNFQEVGDFLQAVRMLSKFYTKFKFLLQKKQRSFLHLISLSGKINIFITGKNILKQFFRRSITNISVSKDKGQKISFSVCYNCKPLEHPKSTKLHY